MNDASNAPINDPGNDSRNDPGNNLGQNPQIAPKFQSKPRSKLWLWIGMALLAVIIIFIVIGAKRSAQKETTLNPEEQIARNVEILKGLVKKPTEAEKKKNEEILEKIMSKEEVSKEEIERRRVLLESLSKIQYKEI